MSEAQDTESGAGRTRSGPGKRSESNSEFFAVGTPLHAVRASYIRRPADELLFEALLAGRYAHIIAPDQSGKSSLIAATAARLENNGVLVANLDLDQLGLRDGGSDAGRFYYSVAYRILRQLRIRLDLQSWWQDKALFSNRQRLHEFYSEVVLAQTKKPVIVFIDEVQCVEGLPFTDQLLTSVRSAHDARTTDPEFTRLTFALSGECDPAALVQVPEHSPFQVTQSIPLRDFTREETELFATELNLSPSQAHLALDRIHHWAGGQPYLTQKLARAVAREAPEDDPVAFVDRTVEQQFTGRASLANEPLLNHVHQRILGDGRSAELLLNLYGRIRKGVEVPTDLGLATQRRLIALGLLTIGERGELAVRNRIYADVFTARWANENLSVRWRTPALVALLALVLLAIPFWYTQWLPRSYVNVLNDATSPLEQAETAWLNLRSFPGHADTADNLYRLYVIRSAEFADSREAIDAIAFSAGNLPNAEELNLSDKLLAGFYDRRVSNALRYEDRDLALLEALNALVELTPARRQRVAGLLAADYPELIATLALPEGGRRFFNPEGPTLSSIDGSLVRQWTLTGQELREIDPWSVTALEVSPLVRRVMVNREGSVSRAGLTLNLSHARHADLRIKIIAPSGKAVEIETGRDRSSDVDDLQIPAEQLSALRGEALAGTWSLSVRDESTGVAGHLVGWNLTLNAQGLVEDFQRGLGIPDPVEVEASSVWVSRDGRYAVARATQSDSARLWDLSFAKPLRAIAVSQNESLIGLDTGARRLITATLDTVNLWDTTTGDQLASLPIQGAGLTGGITEDGNHLFVQYPGDRETSFELWSLDTLDSIATLKVAGTPALFAVDASGRRLAIADFDQSIRVWDFAAGSLVAQLNLSAQPSEILLSGSGDTLGAVYGKAGVSLWRLGEDVGEDVSPMFEIREPGSWQMRFAPAGDRVIAGQPQVGFQVYSASTGRRLGAPLGYGALADAMLAFSADENTVVTGAPSAGVRFWRAPAAPPAEPATIDEHDYWRPAPDAVVTATPDGRKFLTGDRDGHLHIIPVHADPTQLAATTEGELSFLGHSAAVTSVVVDSSSLWAATAAVDNSVRVWSITDGLPRPWVFETVGASAAKLDFSRDSSRLAVLSGTRLTVIERGTGTVVAEVEFAVAQQSLAFPDNSTIYTGGEDGALSAVQLTPGGQIAVQKVWQGDAALGLLSATPRGEDLLLVDAANTVRQLSIRTGQMGRRSLVLPSAVRELAVAPIGARVFVRTPRWIHEVTVGKDGLVWVDAQLVAASRRGRELVFVVDREGRPAVPHRVTIDGNAIALVRLHDENRPGMFGNRHTLLEDWPVRLGRATDGEN
ncbi:MAG: AAA-like domain-containing protein [Pseudomonadota bacterium]